MSEVPHLVTLSVFVRADESDGDDENDAAETRDHCLGGGIYFKTLTSTGVRRDD